ncbi:MAG TPA: hypothetical protein PLO93_05530 [Candidatus Omnitrophota bacterium]|nr:hypothetical protein [Candidatus Omnitrophota bacterium]HQL41735.1 hypothetical protein [Candidatus Omnitrophota bacterium]
MKRSFYLKIFLFVVLLFSSALADAAEVYYLGGPQGSSQEAAVNPSYSLKQRFQDLFSSLSSIRKDPEASGSISGHLSQTVVHNDIGGNREKSYLKPGVNYITDLNFSIQEKLHADYNFTGQWFLRKTDDPRVESRRDVRLKQVDLQVANERNLYQFGDFYGSFSQFVLGSSLEGFNMDINPTDDQHYQIVIARRNEADTVANSFQRNVFGFKADRYLFKGSDLFSDFRIGVQAASSQDDSASLPDNHTAKDLRNTVFGLDGEIVFKQGLSIQYEYAGSAYVEDEDASEKTTTYANAFRFQPSMRLGKANVRYLYYYAQPKFYTDAGSSMSDKIQNQVSLDYRFSDRVNVTVSENYYWDHLKGSSRTKRTFNDEKYMTWNLLPLASRRSFNLRPYVNYQVRNSDDPGNSAESTTLTGGFDISDRLNAHTNWGVGYECRSFIDRVTRSNSEIFHRIRFNWAQDMMLWARRLYYAITPNVDIRHRKGNDNKDVTVGAGFNVQYDLFQRVFLRMGNTLADTNSASPSGDYVNNRGFWEVDFLVDKERSAHFIIRGERNNYTAENGAQSYKEQRVIAKFEVNF